MKNVTSVTRIDLKVYEIIESIISQDYATYNDISLDIHYFVFHT